VLVFVVGVVVAVDEAVAVAAISPYNLSDILALYLLLLLLLFFQWCE
jgi:hypothetical protein